MSAGTGVTHSEFNASRSEPVHFLQIWIEPAQRGVKPGYEQKHFPYEEKRGRLRLVVSPDGVQGSVVIHQQAWVYALLLDSGERVAHSLPPGHLAYVHVARGALVVNGQALGSGDGLKVTAEAELTFEQGRGAEVLLFQMAPAHG
jgi:redox-sensitive bicupin YhaK (pirin superfamily)